MICSGRICDTLCVLVPFVQFLKSEKHPWGSVIFSNATGFSLLLKITILLFLFHTCLFYNCTNGTKSHKASHIRKKWWASFVRRDCIMIGSNIMGLALTLLEKSIFFKRQKTGTCNSYRYFLSWCPASKSVDWFLYVNGLCHERVTEWTELQEFLKCHYCVRLK